MSLQNLRKREIQIPVERTRHSLFVQAAAIVGAFLATAADPHRTVGPVLGICFLMLAACYIRQTRLYDPADTNFLRFDGLRVVLIILALTAWAVSVCLNQLPSTISVP